MRKELTAKGKATRNRIVEGAAVVLREKGVAAATLDDVMAHSDQQEPALGPPVHHTRATPSRRWRD
jgi:AcrR family transcriptional regulator